MLSFLLFSKDCSHYARLSSPILAYLVLSFKGLPPEVSLEVFLAPLKAGTLFYFLCSLLQTQGQASNVHLIAGPSVCPIEPAGIAGRLEGGFEAKITEYGFIPQIQSC